MKDSSFGIYFDSFSCAFASPCQHNNSVTSNFMNYDKNPDFVDVYTNKNSTFIL